MVRTVYVPPQINRTHTVRTVAELGARGNQKPTWEELEIRGKVNVLSPNIFKYTFLRVLYLSHNNLKDLPPQICELVNLQCLDVSNNILRQLPPQLGDMVELRDLRLENNDLRGIPYELGKLFQLENLNLSGNPLLEDGSELSNLYQTNPLDIISFMLERIRFSLTHPPPRSWIAMSTPQRSKPTAIFTVMNYNILANRACTKSLYGYTPEWALHWDYRRRGILEEIRHYSADIICLQEVETEQFDKFFSVEFAKDGYVGVFASKRTHAGSAESRKTQDGCATFWRKNKFKMVDQETIEFGTHARNHANGSPAILNRVQSKDHVGHFVVLETLEGVWDTNGLPSPDYVSRKLLVTNTHVIWDPVQCDVKIVQTIILMEAMKSFLKTKFNIENVSDMPLVLCGDFNSLPESAVVEFLMNGTVCSEHSEFQSFDYSVLDSACTRQDGQHDFSHPFKLRNPYEDKTSTSGATTKYHMNETNYTYNFKGIIDYILHTEHMTPLGVLGPVDPVWFKDSKVVGCPHPHIPSDHFSLLTEFELGVLHKNDNSQVSHTKK